MNIIIKHTGWNSHRSAADNRIKDARVAALNLATFTATNRCLLEVEGEDYLQELR